MYTRKRHCLMSLPTRERELKLAPKNHGVLTRESLPTRERELKLYPCWKPQVSETSLPTRERELKQAFRALLFTASCRSPRGSVN